MLHLGALEILFSIQDDIASFVWMCRSEPDLVQEVFNDLALRILEGTLIPQGNTPKDQRAYLRTTAYHRIVDYLRQRNRRPDSLPLEILEGLAPFVTEALDDRDLWLAALRQCLHPLPEKLIRELLNRYGYGLTVSDLKELGDPRRADTIYKSHDQLLKQLRTCMEQRLAEHLKVSEGGKHDS